MTDPGFAPPPPAPRAGTPSGVAIPGTRAIFTGSFLVVVFGIMTVAIASQGGPLWAGIPAALGLVFIALGVWGRFRAMRVWRHGEHCGGRVVHTWTNTTGIQESKHTAYLVQYEYVVDGQQYLTKHGTSGGWSEGPVWVIYDPKNPTNSMPMHDPSP